jgi:hypothetical protein
MLDRPDDVKAQICATSRGVSSRGEIHSTRLGSGIVAAGGLSPLAFAAGTQGNRLDRILGV